MTFSNLPDDYQTALAEVKMWRERHKQKCTWVGLTTDEIKEVAERYHLKPPNVPVAFRTIEAKLREKNT